MSFHGETRSSLADINVAQLLHRNPGPNLPVHVIGADRNAATHAPIVVDPAVLGGDAYEPMTPIGPPLQLPYIDSRLSLEPVELASGGIIQLPAFGEDDNRFIGAAQLMSGNLAQDIFRQLGLSHHDAKKGAKDGHTPSLLLWATAWSNHMMELAEQFMRMYDADPYGQAIEMTGRQPSFDMTASPAGQIYIHVTGGDFNFRSAREPELALQDDLFVITATRTTPSWPFGTGKEVTDTMFCHGANLDRETMRLQSMGYSVTSRRYLP